MLFELHKIFITIVEAESFSRAAKLLHMSQPAISNQVRSLESYLGVSLFHRTTKGITLTESGKIFYSYALKLEQSYTAMKTEMNKITNPVEISIGTSCITAKTLPYFIKDYNKTNHTINFKVDVATPVKQFEGLKNQLFDFIMICGVLDELNNINDYSKCEIGTHDFVFVSTNSGIWKNLNSISLKNLKKCPLIIREKKATDRILLEKILTEYDFTLEDFNVISEMNRPSAIKAAVASGLGIALVPKILVEDELFVKKLKIINIAELDNNPVKVPIQLIYSNHTKITNPTKHFMDFIISNRHRYSEKKGIFV